ncbi:MAG: nucleotide-binding universal stress UspA family protein [Pirellulaceae bacterium]|jgi:nucleotide-binding universal stress UspA family protein
MSTFAKNVVVPVDFSDESLIAVKTAIEIAGDPTRVQAIHVLPELHPAAPGVIWQTINDADRKEHAMTALRSQLEDRKCDGVSLHIEFGDPGYRIAKHAENIGADLIVIPSHGRSGIARLLLGSVAERVIRLAHCQILVLRSSSK